MVRLLVCALVALAPGRALADGIAIVGGSPRAIGRAGAATLGDDGGGALLINPAAMARRDTARAEVGAAVIEDDVRWQTDAAGAPLSRGQAGSRIAPLAAAIASVGGFVIGAGVMTAAVSEHSLARPSDLHTDLGSDYNYRYAGIAGAYRRDTVALGAARRIGNSLALGLAIGVAQVRVSEHRRLWAGLAGPEMIGDPKEDLDLTMTGVDRLTESAVAGVLYAPEDSRIELGASVGWANTVKLAGTIAATADPENGPSIAATQTPHAQLEVRQPVAVRAGGRYVGDHFVAELDGDLWIAPPDSELTSWSVTGLRLSDAATQTELQTVPSRISQRTHAALRAALDVEVMAGFLWATAGYARSTPGTPAADLSPSFGDLGGQTLALGLEASAGSFTVTLGWSRTWSPTTAAPTDLRLDNPFGTGDAKVPSGTYDGSLDQVGVLLEVELDRASR